MKRLLREPFIHFVALGALVFVTHEARRPDLASESTIVVPDGYEQLARKSLRSRLGREPTAREIDEAIGKYIDEEILYREAQRLGLDRNDTIVRRRLVQKMKLILDSEMSEATITAGDLKAVQRVHPELFADAARASFEHVFIRGNDQDAKQRARAIADRLRAGDHAGDDGDAFSRGSKLDGISRRDANALFGPRFAEALFSAAPNTWLQPIESAHGIHIARVIRFVAPEDPSTSPRVMAAARVQKSNSHLRRAIDDAKARYRIALGGDDAIR